MTKPKIERNREIHRLREETDLSLTEIGERCDGISKQRVWQILNGGDEKYHGYESTSRRSHLRPEEYARMVNTLGGYTSAAQKLGVSRQTLYRRIGAKDRITYEAEMAIRFLIQQEKKNGNL